MIPYSYNMVDMGGIDLAEANCTEVPGIYEKVVEAMNLCGDLIIYNWKFAGINIAPSAYTVLQQADSIIINGLIQVTELDLVTVIGIPPPVLPVSPLDVTENGIYEATPPASGFNPVSVAIPERVPIIEPLTVDRNGTYYAQENTDGYAPVIVQVAGGQKGFEVYAADGLGSQRREQGWYNNNYFVCFFDDNMSTSYTLNGVTYQYSVIATGKQQLLAATDEVIDNPAPVQVNGFLAKEGSVFTASHGDTGSYISVVGGWVGYPHGGDIYEATVVGTTISLTLDSVFETLLIFIGASSNISGINTILVNGNTYSIENIGAHYGAYGMYTAIEVNDNPDTTVEITFPASCWIYVSIIGLN